jgi:uncharacterized membrane protein (DUF485 family)
MMLLLPVILHFNSQVLLTYFRVVSCQALTVDVAQIIITWVITQCWVNFLRRFGEACYLHLRVKELGIGEC